MLIINSSEVYRPLTLDDQIRLLRLYPGVDGEKLVCQLLHFRLQDFPSDLSYEAISYTWSDQDGVYDQSRALYFVDGDRAFQISKNCHSALCKVRNATTARMIWIDAVCIDQKNLVERAEQVKIMPKIFGLAEKVIVFLGDLEIYEVPHFTALFRHIKQDRYIPSHLQPWWEQLLSRRWFKRIWVIQEVILANYTIFLLGPLSIDWEQLQAVIDNGKPTASSRSTIPWFRLWMKDLGSYNMIEVFCLTSECDASDPRDKIYGLIGLLPEKFARDIKPDYRKSVTEVYKDATFACVRQIGSPKVLQFFQIDASHNPSWIIDFSCPLVTSQAFISKLPNTYSPPKLARLELINETLRSTPDVLVISNDEELRVRGVRIDIISSTQDPEKFKGHEIFKLPEKLEDLRSIEHIRRLLAERMAGFMSSITSLNQKDSVAMGNVLHCQWEPSVKKIPVSNWPQSWFEDGLNAIELLAPYFVGEEQETERQRWEALQKDTSGYCPQFALDLYRKISSFGNGSESRLYIGRRSIGLCPAATQKGDLVYKLKDVDSLTVVRNVSNRFRMVGHCVMVTAVNCNTICKQVRAKECGCVHCQHSRVWNDMTKRQPEKLEDLLIV